MSSNAKISYHVASISPQYVQEDHENFIAFMEAYYEFLEQDGNVIDRIKNLNDLHDVDKSPDDFVDHLYTNFLHLIPEEAVVDKRLLLKHVKDFYRSRGTEKSFRFLLRILFNNNDVEFYYPKRDVLRASDGKWFIEKSLKIGNAFFNSALVDDLATIKNKFQGRQIIGSDSGATALVERVDVYYENGTLVREVKISNQTKDFVSGENISANTDGGTISANIFSGIINSLTINGRGTGYHVGDRPLVSSNTGTGAVIEVASVSTGNIRSIFVVEGGAGFHNNDFLLVTGGGGSGGNANISMVDTSGNVHPNSYVLCSTTIGDWANNAIGDSSYAGSLTVDPANNWVQNSISTFTYANTGPVTRVFVISSGSNYTTEPSLSIKANTRVRELGILGRMEIIDGGIGYASNNKIEFLNVSGGRGYGARANVISVDGNGAITGVRFEAMDGFPVGGMGYEQTLLPTANVISGTGSNAAIEVTTLLGFGEALQTVSDALGTISSLRIVSGGSGYQEAPLLDFSTIGDGTANVTATIVKGIFTYPGRYLNDDGHLSSYNFLQDRDYYQSFSYVVKTKQSIERYRKYLKDLVHPAGMKMFGEYKSIDTERDAVGTPVQNVTTSARILVDGTYVATANLLGTKIIINTGRDVSGVVTSYIEYLTGNTELKDGFYTVQNSNTTSFISYQPSLKVNTSGTVMTSI